MNFVWLATVFVIGAQVNKSTGFHIHHNVRTWGIAEFRNLYKRFVKFETGLDAVQPASRRGSVNKYCGSMYGAFTPNADVQSGLFQRLDTCRTVRQSPWPPLRRPPR